MHVAAGTGQTLSVAVRVARKQVHRQARGDKGKVRRVYGIIDDAFNAKGDRRRGREARISATVLQVLLDRAKLDIPMINMARREVALSGNKFNMAAQSHTVTLFFELNVD